MEEISEIVAEKISDIVYKKYEKEDGGISLKPKDNPTKRLILCLYIMLKVASADGVWEIKEKKLMHSLWDKLQKKQAFSFLSVVKEFKDMLSRLENNQAELEELALNIEQEKDLFNHLKEQEDQENLYWIAYLVGNIANKYNEPEKKVLITLKNKWNLSIDSIIEIESNVNELIKKHGK